MDHGASSGWDDDPHGRFTFAFEQRPLAMAANWWLLPLSAVPMVGGLLDAIRGSEPMLVSVLVGTLVMVTWIFASAYRRRGAIVVTASEVRIDGLVGWFARRHKAQLRTQATSLEWEAERFTRFAGTQYWSVRLVSEGSVDLRWIRCTEDQILALRDAMVRFREIGAERAGSPAEVPDALRQTARVTAARRSEPDR